MQVQEEKNELGATGNIKPSILAVDDTPFMLHQLKEILAGQYDVRLVKTAERAFAFLSHSTVDLILLDVEMPEMNGYEVIKRLKESPATKEIPVIFLTSLDTPEDELEGLSLGAMDYVYKPFSPPLLLKRIENCLTMERQRASLVRFNGHLRDMVDEKTKELVELQDSILRIVATIVEFRDKTTGGHDSRTQHYLKLLLDEMVVSGVYAEEISKWDIHSVISASLLHDVGKIAISDAILRKPSSLTDEEFNAMKQHPLIGEEIIESIERTSRKNDFLYHAKIIAGSHHEKWDGSGYPRHLVGEGIPLQGRLMAIADVYDALMSRRPYKPPMPATKAHSIISEGSGSHFDPALITIFEKLEPRFAELATDTSLDA
jgi:putative two-component system response regulator